MNDPHTGPKKITLIEALRCLPNEEAQVAADEIERLQDKLDKAKALPDEWRKIREYYWVNECADELQAILEGDDG